jgi:hypothetical protein
MYTVIRLENSANVLEINKSTAFEKIKGTLRWRTAGVPSAVKTKGVAL